MSRKHPHRSETKPVTKRELNRALARLRNDLLSAIVNSRKVDDMQADEMALLAALDRASLPWQRPN